MDAMLNFETSLGLKSDNFGAEGAMRSATPKLGLFGDFGVMLGGQFDSILTSSFSFSSLDIDSIGDLALFFSSFEDFSGIFSSIFVSSFASFATLSISFS